jgi:hypothetical protein
VIGTTQSLHAKVTLSTRARNIGWVAFGQMLSRPDGSPRWFVALQIAKQVFIFGFGFGVLSGNGSALLAATKTNPPSGPVEHVTFAQLAACPLVMQQEGADAPALEKQVSEPIRAVTGKWVEITGYMLPLVMENGRARELLLMRTQMGCCYGQVPAANEYLVVRQPPGLRVVMDIPVKLRGILRVAPVVMSGLVVEFYDLDEAILVDP